MRAATRAMLALVSAALLLAAGAAAAAQHPDSGQALLRAATDKAVVDGDLQGAIKHYQLVVSREDRGA